MIYKTKKKATACKLKIGCWNIQGLQNKDVDKTRDQSFIDQIRGYDIVALTETHTVEGQTENIEVKDYDIYAIHRPKHIKATHGSGGIMLLIRSGLRDGIKIIPCQSKDYVWVKLDKEFFSLEDDIYLCAVYSPPPDSAYSKRLDTDILEQIEIDTYKYKKCGQVILIGDFNARTGTAPDYIIHDNDNYIPLDEKYPIDSSLQQRQSQDNIIDDRGKHLLEICIAAQLRILNGRKIGDSIGHYTSHQYNGSSVIDYAVCSESILNRIASFHVHDLIGSLTDHCMISFTLISNFHPRLQDTNLRKLPLGFKWDDKRESMFQQSFNLPPIQNRILKVTQDMSKHDTEEGGIDNIASQVEAIYIESAKLSLKHRQVKKINMPKPRPWNDANIRKLEREVNRKGHLMTAYPTGENRTNFFLALKYFRKARKYARRNFKNKQLTDLTKLQQNNPREFWAKLDQIKNGNNGKNADSNKISPGCWYDYLSNLNKCNIESNQTNFDSLEAINFNTLDFTIKKDEIQTAINTLKRGKASGLDGISGEMVKCSIKHMLQTLEKLFNKIYSSGTYPTLWAAGYITCLHKKGSKLDPSNYRGITITSVLGKVFNSILNTRLNKFLREGEHISPLQIGFEKGSSTSDHIFTLKTILDKYMQGSNKVYTCFIDFKKAFDKVWHTGLFSKLNKIGVNNHFLKVIRDMYTKTKLCLKTNEGLTNDFISQIGVRQGDPLSPTLFKIYVNDIVDSLKNTDNTTPVNIGEIKINCLLYADDIILISRTKSGLQKCLDTIHTFSKRWHMPVNTQKTKVMIFNRAGRFLKEKYTLGNEMIECVNEYSYLGISLSSSGSFTKAAQKLYEKGLKAMFGLSRLLDGRYNVQTMLYIFDHTLKAIMLYGAEVWGSMWVRTPCKDPDIERMYDKQKCSLLELRFLKQLLQVKRNTATPAVRGELGRFPLAMFALLASIKYYYRILNKESNTLVKAALKESKQLHAQGVTSWYTKIKEIMKVLNLDHLMQNNKCDKYAVNLAIKQLKVRYESHWHDALWSDENRRGKCNLGGNKLRTYRTFKTNFQQEKYISNIENQQNRRSMCQLRVSAHNLYIEAQRGKIKNPEDRKCPFCTQTTSEDEMHFFIVCTKYKYIRDQMYARVRELSKNFGTLSDEHKFVWLLSNEDKTINKITANFIKGAFEIRNMALLSKAEQHGVGRGQNNNK